MRMSITFCFPILANRDTIKRNYGKFGVTWSCFRVIIIEGKGPDPEWGGCQPIKMGSGITRV